MKKWSPTERIGVAAAQLVCVQELEWIFREMSVSDVGIDAQIEQVTSGGATGKIIGVQIKTGASYLKETGKGLVYYGSEADLDYWAEYSLPVIMIFHNPEKKVTLWVNIDESSITRTLEAWHIVIPEDNTFDRRCKGELEQIFRAGSNHLPLRRSYRVAQVSSDEEDLLFHVGEIARNLMLDSWDRWIEGACCTHIVVLPEAFVEGLKEVRFNAMKLIVPPEFKRTECAIINLIERASDLIDEFRPRAEYIQIQKSYQGVHFYARYENPNYARDRAEHEAWSLECVGLVYELAKAANLFADLVREELDRGFLRRRGRFLVSDDFQHGCVAPQYLEGQKSRILQERGGTIVGAR
ncbi:DUF4365 domain-containing protein [Pseudomonas oleovorans]|uniref:DUF4365 domain-containing protein n=1 Tax=Ectopseudomonas oleovorans TaxID=301 RepID=A0AB35L437_ECTOL|nr:DUF4365 domain-containing protein [Pseudomonas oleovorans]MCR1829038.1 DUF4365 domain-containing protein [Pseudomonas oleovorans]MDH0568855.1 DUF4365 domain-containing protein [Pseudomonas oleovorans]